jgi:signal transduction histidine kinase
VTWAAAALTPALILAAVIVDLTLRRPGDEALPAAVSLAIVVAISTPTLVAVLILRGQPGNVVGWIMLLGPLPIALLAACELYAGIGVAGGDPLPAQPLVAAVNSALWPAFYLWPVAIALLFPAGRLPSPRWRPAAAVTLAAPVLVVLLLLFGQERSESHFGAPANPLYIPAFRFLVPVFWIAWSLMLAGLFVAAAAVVVRYRRSAGVERLQLKWLAWSASLIPLGLLVCVGSYVAVGGVAAVVPVVLLAAGVAVSVSVGIAVTRHGLYEIDRIVNRTVVYVGLTALLLAAFAVVALAAGVVLGRGSVLGTALATLVTVLAFRPARERIQRVVDRRFARARYEGLRRIRSYEDALRRGEAEAEELEPALAEALKDPTLTLWLRLPQTDAYCAVDGREVSPDEVGSRDRTRVMRHGEELAIVVHDRCLRERPDLLRSVLDAAALSIEVARLRAEVRRQLSRVEASRARLVEAGDEERRRLERDLHDGAQQRLVGLGVALRRMQRSLPREARVLGPHLDEAVAQVGSAIADLRTIAAGLRPPRLDDGLAAALGDLARSSPVPVSVRVDAEDLPAPLEVAAYYTVCEALTNAIKHASASHVEVEAVRRDGRLRVRVRDDGAGGAVARGGSGLAGISDRVGAHGGRLLIDSPPGGGTLLEAELPCAS